MTVGASSRVGHRGRRPHKSLTAHADFNSSILLAESTSLIHVGKHELEQTSHLKFIFQITNVVEFGNLSNSSLSTTFFSEISKTMSGVPVVRTSPIPPAHNSPNNIHTTTQLPARGEPPSITSVGRDPVQSTKQLFFSPAAVTERFSLLQYLFLVLLAHGFSGLLQGKILMMPKQLRSRQKFRRVDCAMFFQRCVRRDVFPAVCSENNRISSDHTPDGYTSSAQKVHLFKVFCGLL